MNIFKKFFYALLRTNKGRANSFEIAKHLSKCLLDFTTVNPDLKYLYPDFRLKAEKILEKFPEITIICTLRTFKEQNELYKQGRTKPGRIVTNARAGESYHNFGLSFDFMFKDDPNWASPRRRWEEVGKYAELLGCVWGGEWDDLGHVEYSKFVKWRDLKPHFT